MKTLNGSQNDQMPIEFKALKPKFLRLRAALKPIDVVKSEYKC